MNPEEENTTQQEEGTEEEEQEQTVLSEEEEVPTEAAGPSLADRAAARAAILGAKTGQAAGGLLRGVGSQLGEPAPPEDDLSDLFEGPDMERDNDVYTKDLTTVTDEDVLGEGGEEGLDDVLEVSEEDVMGDEDYTGYGAGRSTPRQPTRRISRAIPQGGLAGLQ